MRGFSFIGGSTDTLADFPDTNLLPLWRMLPSTTLAGGDTTLSRDVEADVRYDVEVEELGSQDGGENAPRPELDGGENALRPELDGGENAPRPQDGGENAPRPQDGGENAPRPQDGGENAPRPDERDGGVKDMADCVSFIFLPF